MPILESLISVVAPHSCLVCSTEGRLICRWCAVEAFSLLPSRCYNCKKLTDNSSVCTTCRRKSPLKHVWIRTEYSLVAKDLIYEYKFNHARSAAGLIANYMGEALPYTTDVIVTSVPTATSRVRQRGFDHSRLLAKELAKQKGLKYDYLLARMGQLKQVGTKRATRQKQAENSFRATTNLTGARILLIDDVTTTGATLEQAAKALKKAGAKSVNALVFAQTM